LAARLRALRLPQRPSTGQVTAVVLVVDGPGQAMSFEEEFQGLHQTLAQLRAEGERTILAGYATVGLIVGAAVSGGLLCHGLGAQRLIALDHPAVDIRPMAPAGSQRLLERSAGQAALAGPQLTALQTSGRAFLRLGGVQALVPVAPADALGAADVARVRAALTEQLLAARHNLQHHGERFEPASFGSRVWAKEVWGVMADT
jgi:biotin-independent malonate decarboxylase gamma subunit